MGAFPEDLQYTGKKTPSAVNVKRFESIPTVRPNTHLFHHEKVSISMQKVLGLTLLIVLIATT